MWGEELASAVMSGRVAFVAGELDELANPQKAAAMAAYMKTDMPFYGVQKKARDGVYEEMLRRFPVGSRREYTTAVVELWQRPHREEKYLAVGLAKAYSQYQTVGSLPLYRKLIVEGAWWDFVDEIAINLVGAVWLRHRERTTPMIERWVDDDDMWLRRSAIVGQLKHKTETDEALLFDFCLRRAGEREFFIRKAIGWALREYAKTAPDAVRAFVTSHEEVWSGLTFREATKHL